MGESSGKCDLVGLEGDDSLWARRDEARVRRELTERFMPFTRSIAARYQSRAESFDDLLQVASLGLMNAIDRFDPEQETPFLAFASPTIHGELRRHFRDHVSAIRLPRGLYELIGRMDRTVGELRSQLQREPSDGQIAEALDCSLREVEEAREAPGIRHPISTFGEDNEEQSVEDILGKDDPAFGQAECRILARDSLYSLDAEDRRIVALRFGQDLSQSQIAERIGCSQMQVSRKIRQILERLRSRAASA